MGGHGGLNILPQKRWNVYGRENRLKVSRDEAAHAAREAELQEKHRAAEAQARRSVLLERARQRRRAALGVGGEADGGADEDAARSTGSEPDDEPLTWRQGAAAPAAAAAAAGGRAGAAGEALPPGCRSSRRAAQAAEAEAEPDAEPVLQHINFWAELEAKAQHPERAAEARNELKRRGNPDTHTSDAHFDASFQLAHGLTGPKPWYARDVDPLATAQAWQALASKQQARQLQAAARQQQQQQQQQQRAATLPAPEPEQRSSKRRKRRRGSSSSSSSDCSDSDSSSSSDSSAERRRRHSRSSKRRTSHRSSRDKRKKHSRKRSRGSPRCAASGAAAAGAGGEADARLVLARLRAERLAREAAERQRSLVATGQMPAPSKRYNQAYGYADALRGQQQAAAAAVAAARSASAAAGSGLGARFGPR